jgi:hypothetical protein
VTTAAILTEGACPVPALSKDFIRFPLVNHCVLAWPFTVPTTQPSPHGLGERARAPMAGHALPWAQNGREGPRPSKPAMKANDYRLRSVMIFIEFS